MALEQNTPTEALKEDAKSAVNALRVAVEYDVTTLDLARLIERECVLTLADLATAIEVHVKHGLGYYEAEF